MKYDVEIHRESFYNTEDVDVKHYEIDAESLEEAENEAQKLAIRVEIASTTRLVSNVIVSLKNGELRSEKP